MLEHFTYLLAKMAFAHSEGSCFWSCNGIINASSLIYSRG